MRLSHLREFVTLASRRNFTLAARDLHVAQSTLSKHMIDLQRETGLHLLESAPRVGLTASGAEFLRYAERVLRTYGEGLEECRAIELGTRWSLSVEDPIVFTAMTDRLNGMLEAFREANPDITTSIRADESLTTVENIDKGVFDIAQGVYRRHDLRSVSIDGREFSLVPFMDDEVVLWVPRESVLAVKPDLRFSDLAGVEVSLPGSMLWAKWREMLAELAREHGFSLCTSLSITDSVNEYWSASPNRKVFLLVGQIARETRVAARGDMVIRRFAHDDASFTFYHLYDAHSKNPAVARFDDWCAREGAGTWAAQAARRPRDGAE